MGKIFLYLKFVVYFLVDTHSLCKSFTLAIGIGVVRSCFNMMYNLMIFFYSFYRESKEGSEEEKSRQVGRPKEFYACYWDRRRQVLF